MSKRKLAYMTVDPDIVERALGMPDNHHIVAMEWDNIHRTMRIYIEGPDMPTLEHGVEPMQITPSIQWNWNIPTAGK